MSEEVPFQLPIRLISVDASQNRQRFYELHLQQDLFDQLVLVRTYGRLGKAGRVFTRSYSDEVSLQKDVLVLVRRRLQHGYQLVWPEGMELPITGRPIANAE